MFIFLKNTRARLRSLAGALSIVAFIVPAIAWAQAPVLEEVVVTAQKREQSLQDVPISVNALSADYLAKTNSKDFGDVSRISSGVTLAAPADGQQGVIRIRGFGSSVFSGGRSAVRFFIDEVPLLRTDEAFTNMMDLERIEILKGPQSTLFGKEALGGAISLITAKPNTDNFEGTLEAQLASFERADVQAAFNLPVSESMAWRIAASTKTQSDSQIDNLVGDTTELESKNLRTKLLLNLADALSATISYDYYDGEVANVIPEVLAYGDLKLSAAEKDQLIAADPFDGEVQYLESTTRTTENERMVLRLEGELSDSWSFTAITGYQDWYQLSSPADSIGGISTIFPVFTEAESQSFSQEIRFNYAGDVVDNVWGLFYADTNTAGDTGFSFWLTRALNVGVVIPRAISTAQLSVSDASFEDTGIFFHSTCRIGEDQELIYGMRYSSVRETSRSTRFTLQGLTPDNFISTFFGGGGFSAALQNARSHPDLQPLELSETFRAFSGTIKLRRKLREHLSIYGGVDRGFKAGGSNTSAQSGNVIEPGDRFDGETTMNYEVGFKGDFLDRSLRWNTSFFVQRYKDLQVTFTPAGEVTGFTDNAATAEIQGVETEFSWLLNEKIVVDGNVAYINSRYKDYPGAPCLRAQFAREKCATGSQDFSDKPLSHVSPWTANLNFTYNDVLPNGMNWYARAEMAYRDSWIGLTDLDPAALQEEYTLLNASFSLSGVDRSWEAVLWVKNITDEEYITHFQQSRDATSTAVPGAVPPTGTTTLDGDPVTQPTEGLLGYIGEERTFGLSLKHYF